MCHIQYLSTFGRHTTYGRHIEYHLLAGHHSVMSHYPPFFEIDQQFPMISQLLRGPPPPETD